MADKRKLGSGERKFRDRSKNNPSGDRTRSNIRRKRNLTEEEKLFLMKRRARLRRKKAEARKARIIFAVLLVLGLFLVFQAFSMTFRFIEKNRNAQKKEQESTGETLPESSSEEETEESTEEESPSEGETNAEGLVFSGGRYLDPKKPMVALTYDDGPDVQVDAVLMDELEKVNGRATFFVVGQRVEKYPEDIKNAVERGHEIGNHSYDHDIHLSTKGAEYIRNEFEKTDAAVEKASGVKPALIRLPGGNISNDVKSVIQRPMIFWTIDTEDWRSRDAEKTKNTILSNVKDGDIVLMHALYLSTAEACKTVIPELNARGYQLVTVSELIKFRGLDDGRKNGVQYTAFPPLPASQAPASSVSSESLSRVESAEGAVSEKSGESSVKKSTEEKKSKETEKESKETKSTKKQSTEGSTKKAQKDSTKESGNIVDSPGATVESRNTETKESTAQGGNNISGAIDAEDPR